MRSMTEAADKDLKNLFHVFRDRKENINKQKINGGAKKNKMELLEMEKTSYLK